MITGGTLWLPPNGLTIDGELINWRVCAAHGDKASIRLTAHRCKIGPPYAQAGLSKCFPYMGYPAKNPWWTAGTIRKHGNINVKESECIASGWITSEHFLHTGRVACNQKYSGFSYCGLHHSYDFFTTPLSQLQQKRALWHKSAELDAPHLILDSGAVTTFGWIAPGHNTSVSQDLQKKTCRVA